MSISIRVAWNDDDIEQFLKEANRTVIMAQRRSGKTTKLLRHIQREYDGKAIVVVINREMADCMRRLHLSLFGNVQSPHIVPLGNIYHLRGHLLPIHVDEWTSLTWDHQMELGRHPDFVAGVSS